MIAESYKDKTFLVENADARVRKANDLTKFVTSGNGAPKTIPARTSVNVMELRLIPAGSKAVNIFVRAVSPDGSTEWGWTSANNLKGRLQTETIGKIEPEAGATRFGPNAAWSKGLYIGQITLLNIVGTNSEIEQIAEQTGEAFQELTQAAHRDGCILGINSGFRSYPEQKQLWEGWQRRLPGFNPANPPGQSNHQNGIAFDLNVGSGPGNANYDWLAKNATEFGFVRTVKREVWHWEYLPTKAASARRRGSHESYE